MAFALNILIFRILVLIPSVLDVKFDKIYLVFQVHQAASVVFLETFLIECFVLLQLQLKVLVVSFILLKRFYAGFPTFNGNFLGLFQLFVFNLKVLLKQLDERLQAKLVVFRQAQMRLSYLS